MLAVFLTRWKLLEDPDLRTLAHGAMTMLKHREAMLKKSNDGIAGTLMSLGESGVDVDDAGVIVIGNVVRVMTDGLDGLKPAPPIHRSEHGSYR